MTKTARDKRLNEFARRLDIWITERNLTLSQTAERLGISVHSLKKYRYKEHMPRDRELVSIEKRSDDGGEPLLTADLLANPPADQSSPEEAMMARVLARAITGRDEVSGDEAQAAALMLARAQRELAAEESAEAPKRDRKRKSDPGR